MSTTVSSTGGGSKIDGLISGLDTTSIINAIMAQAALPQTNLKNNLALQQAKLLAYQTINSKFAAMQTAADALTSATTWQAMAVTSSSPSVTATASAGAQAGNFTFDVTQLASYQSSVFANSVSSTSATVVSGGTPVTITSGSGSPVTIDTGDGSLGAVVAGINKSNSGVQATAVQVSPGQYKLQLTSSATGANAAFSVTGLGSLGAMQNTSTAQDAQITVGAGTPAQYTISSSTNTFSDAIPNMTFTVSQLATGVSLQTSPDGSGIADKVQAMVDSANAVLTEITNDTAYDAQKQQASVLTGDMTAESLRNNILGAVGSMLGNGTSATSVGLSVTKDGQITFDRDAFQSAFDANPSSVQAAFTPGATFAPAQSGLTGTITLQKSTDATQPGSYDVTVTQAATKASATIDTSGGISAGQTITLGSGSSSATYTVQAGDTAQTIVDGLNALAATNKLGITSTLGSNGLINLASTGYGSQFSFTSSTTGGLVASAVTAGTDVAGTINGQAAKGIGQVLYTASGTPGVDAIMLNVTLTAADVAALGGGSAGTFAYSAGVAQNLGITANAAISSQTGALTNEINGVNSTITSLNTSIANWQTVLDTKQAALQLQWANLENQLGQLQATGSQLTSAIAGLPGYSTSSSKSTS
ncbi:MAG TPA: flagellar filament capping protein FliD [Acidothermaceae bacterium]|nr:flagellar filament capping protein FliD [Acidothermaceae bacterium]